VLPHLLLDEVQERDDVERPQLRAQRLAVEEEVEELEADGVALGVEAGSQEMLAFSPAFAAQGRR
jgi:hypothetical protein